MGCLAPSAFRLGLDDLQGGRELRISYTNQFSLMILQCTPRVNTTISMNRRTAFRKKEGATSEYQR